MRTIQPNCRSCLSFVAELVRVRSTSGLECVPASLPAGLCESTEKKLASHWLTAVFSPGRALEPQRTQRAQRKTKRCYLSLCSLCPLWFTLVWLLGAMHFVLFVVRLGFFCEVRRVHLSFTGG